MVNSYKMGPGKLIFKIGTALDVTAQVTACTITPTENVTTTEEVPTLDGGKIAAEDEVTFSYVLAANIVQDLAANALVDWSWIKAGQTATFVFAPNVAANRGVSGSCVVVPLTIGGDVKSRPQSDLSYRCVGTPIFGVYDPITTTVTEDV